MPRAKKPKTPPESDFEKVAYMIPALPGVRPCPFCKGRAQIEVRVNDAGDAFCAFLRCLDCLMAGPPPRFPDPTGPLAASRAVDQWNGMLDGTHDVCGVPLKPADVPVRDELWGQTCACEGPRLRMTTPIGAPCPDRRLAVWR